MNLEYMKISLFEISYNKKTFFTILDAPVYTVYICIFFSFQEKIQDSHRCKAALQKINVSTLYLVIAYLKLMSKWQKCTVNKKSY